MNTLHSMQLAEVGILAQGSNANSVKLMIAQRLREFYSLSTPFTNIARLIADSKNTQRAQKEHKKRLNAVFHHSRFLALPIAIFYGVALIVGLFSFG